MTMLCFWLEVDGEEWGAYHHAKTRGKAKVAFAKEYNLPSWLWTEIRARRHPIFDDKPITFEGSNYTNEDGTPISEDEFTNYCNCPLCKDNRP